MYCVLALIKTLLTRNSKKTGVKIKKKKMKRRDSEAPGGECCTLNWDKTVPPDGRSGKFSILMRPGIF